MSTVSKLKCQKESLLSQLEEIEKELNQKEKKKDSSTSVTKNSIVGNNNSTATTTTTTATATASSSIMHYEKSGYLYKWQDRTIGWTGTKWDLRFVRLEMGRLSYYKTHSDPSPRYVLTLRNCAVRDDGYKQNGRYWKRNSEVEVDVQTPGAYYHVFSIYQRAEGSNDTSSTEVEDEENIVPLLRFSTQSYAEKTFWIDQLSAACAVCDTEEFRQYEKEMSEAAIAQKLNGTSTSTPTSYRNGTLPPLYFAPAPPPKLLRQPSNATFIKLENASYVKLSSMKDAHKSNPQHKSGYPPSKPMHRSAEPSYLSDEAPMQNYRGLLNLGIIILVISNFRILLMTMREYGFVVFDWMKTMESASTYWKAVSTVEFPLLSGLGILFFFVNYAYAIELATSKKWWAEWFGVLMHVINVVGALVVPTAIVWYQIDSVVGGVILTMCAAILFMKLISYAHANTDYRNHPERCVIHTTDFIQNVDSASKSVTYPENITLSDIYYFWFAPTLTYQIAYPRLPKRDWIRIVTLIMRIFLVTVLIIFLLAQVVSPSLRNLTKDLENGKHVFSAEIFGEYLMKLAMASTYVWLLVFYGYFHLFFNLLAELLKFGDRVFYKDWWNSSNVSAYWRLWNLPVHYWLVRHLYFPCVRMGLNKNVAMIIVFFFSAVMHEYIISVPFQMIPVRPWAFAGMMGQIPLVAITKYVDKMKPGSSIGNMIFWLTFCIVGQPMAILMYTIDYYNKNEGIGSKSCNGFRCDEL